MCGPGCCWAHACVDTARRGIVKPPNVVSSTCNSVQCLLATVARAGNLIRGRGGALVESGGHAGVHVLGLQGRAEHATVLHALVRVLQLCKITRVTWKGINKLGKNVLEAESMTFSHLGDPYP